MTRPAKTVGRACARSGCRAWAMRGQEYCSAHRADRQPAVAAVDEIEREGSDERRLRAEAFARLARSGRHEELIEGLLRRVMDNLAGERTLLPEIGALRLQLQRVVAVDALEGDPHQVAVTMTRVVDTIVRAMRMQHALTGELADTVSAAFTTVLLEMGLGDEP
jgi:hypothetical protein